MGGSGEPRPSRSSSESPAPKLPRREPDELVGDGDFAGGGTGGGQESGDAGRTEACPSDFSAEVTDIPLGMQEAAAGVIVGAELAIELRDDDPAFLFDGELLGWLAVNIEEVTECLQAGWRYRGIVRESHPTPGGQLILTQVFGGAPAS